MISLGKKNLQPKKKDVESSSVKEWDKFYEGGGAEGARLLMYSGRWMAIRGEEKAGMR